MHSNITYMRRIYTSFYKAQPGKLIRCIIYQLLNFGIFYDYFIYINQIYFLEIKIPCKEITAIRGLKSMKR